MEELKFIGVENGVIIVTTESGMQYRLPVSDALRDAITNAERHIEHADNLPRPRDVQAQLRSGATVRQVAEQFGVDERYIDRFAAPVIAELEHTVDVARNIAVETAHDGDPATFGEFVNHKLRAAEAVDTTWSAWKNQDGEWIVQVLYLHGSMTHDCRWTLDIRHRQLTPLNGSAQALSGSEPLTPAHERQLRPVAPMFVASDPEPQEASPDTSVAEDQSASPEHRGVDQSSGDASHPTSPHSTSAQAASTTYPAPTHPAVRGRNPGTSIGAANVTPIGDALKQRDDATQSLLDRLDRQRGERHAAPTVDESGNDVVEGKGDPSGPLPLAKIREQLDRQHPSAADTDLKPQAATPQTDTTPHTTPQADESTPAAPDLFSNFASAEAADLTEHPTPPTSDTHADRPHKRKRRAMPSWDEIVFGAHSDKE